MMQSVTGLTVTPGYRSITTRSTMLRAASRVTLVAMSSAVAAGNGSQRQAQGKPPRIS